MRSTQRFFDSSRDKEHDDAQFLQIGVSVAKLQPLLNHCKSFMKCVFKPGRRVPGFLVLLLSANFSMCVCGCVCVRPRGY